jgi:hypothetical protein
LIMLPEAFLYLPKTAADTESELWYDICGQNLVRKRMMSQMESNTLFKGSGHETDYCQQQ